MIAKRASYHPYNLSNLNVSGSGKMAFAIVATFLTHGTLFGENFFFIAGFLEKERASSNVALFEYHTTMLAAWNKTVNAGSYREGNTTMHL